MVVVAGSAVVVVAVVVVSEGASVEEFSEGKITPPMKSSIGVGLVVVLMPRMSWICALMMFTRICSRMDPIRAPENLSSSTKAPASSGTGEARKGLMNMRAENSSK